MWPWIPLQNMGNSIFTIELREDQNSTWMSTMTIVRLIVNTWSCVQPITYLRLWRLICLAYFLRWYATVRGTVSSYIDREFHSAMSDVTALESFLRMDEWMPKSRPNHAGMFTTYGPGILVGIITHIVSEIAIALHQCYLWDVVGVDISFDVQHFGIGRTQFMAIEIVWCSYSVAKRLTQTLFNVHSPVRRLTQLTYTIA